MRALWQADSSKDYNEVLKIFELLKEYRNLKLHLADLSDCETAEQMRCKLNLYNKLSKGRLDEFYNDGVDLFNLGRYKVGASRGFWEHSGGFCLFLRAVQEPIVHVSGKLHNGKTNVISIKGKRGAKEEMDQFKYEMRIHPANLTLLMYLQLGRLINNDFTIINGKASAAFNMRNMNSNLYLIPRNYFRLRVNPTSGEYGFDSNIRDKILLKFEKKYETVKKAFSNLEVCLN